MEPHPGSVDTYEHIAQWIDQDFPYSRKDRWDRFGFLGVFADYACSSLGGDLLEIGVGESSIYLTLVSQKFKRRIYHCDVSPSKIVNPMSVPGYLSPAEEISYIEERDEIPGSLKRVVCYAGSSDSMFDRIPITPLALAFIDGDHIYEQAKKDFWNIWPLIMDHGFIVLHDTFPPDESWTDENHCGQVYKLRQELEVMRNKMDILTLTRGTAMGVGLTICRKKPVNQKYYHL